MKVGSSPAGRESVAELVLVALGLWLDSDGDDRVGERHRFELDRSLVCSEHVTGAGVLETNRGNDVAGVDLVDVLLRSRMHA